ncbi:MAG: hypothetical protein JXA78_03195 [Anaerolineales bacterium]|nr:hypothetical protein [Anaerolineales bacterium]
MAHRKMFLRILSLSAVVLLLFLLFSLSACDVRDGRPSPSPTMIVTAFPTDTILSLPDLAIGEIGLEVESEPDSGCADPSGQLWVRVQVANRGDLAAGPFSVEVNRTTQDVIGLDPGALITLWFSEYEPYTSVSVDASLQVAESDESNNKSFRELPIPTQPPQCFPTPTPVIPEAEPLFVLEGHTGKVWSVAFSPDGNLVASGSVDNTLRLWRVGAGQLLRTMQGHPFPVLALEFSPNGVTLVTGSTDGLLRMWLVSNARLLQSLEGHAGWVTGVDISSDGKFIVSCADDFTVRVWRLADGRLVQTIDEGMAQVNSVAFSPDGSTIAWGEADGVVRLRSLGGNWLHVLKATSQAAASVAYAPSGERLAVGYADGAIRIWDTSDGLLLQTLRSHSGLVSSLSFSLDGKWLVSGSHDHTLRLWRLQNGEVLATPALIYAGHTGPVNSVDFSPKEALIASGSDDGAVRLWLAPEE